MKEYEAHPFAELFPLISPKEIQELRDDIKARGLQRPITLYEGKILDGRHRQEACVQAKVAPRYETYRGKDPLGFVLSANMHRRHLTTSQRAMIAAEAETLRHGENLQKPQQSPRDANCAKPTRKDLAATSSVSPRSIAAASKIKDEAPELVPGVKDGTFTIHAATKKLEEKKAKSEPVLDETGYPVPEELHELWARRGEVREMLAQISNVENKLLASQKEKDVLFSTVSFSSAVSKLQFAHMEVAAARLWAVCITCQGRNYAKCTLCKGRGFLSKIKWDTCVSKEAKDIRARANK